MYQVLYVDPPWSYSGFALCEGNRKDYKKRKKAGEVKHHYTGMSTDQLKNLEINPYQVVYADPPWDYGVGNATLQEGQRWAYGKQRNADKLRKENNVPVTLKYPTMSTEELKNLGIDPYQVVYSDPPWLYNNGFILTDGPRKDYIKKLEAGEIKHHYSGMPTEEISALPIKNIIAKDAACFMWTTDTHLPHAIEVMKAWGFQYKTIAFIWIKKTSKGNIVNMLAPWTLKGAEICLLGTRGAMTKHKAVNDVRQIQEAVRREHSRKPDIIRNEIARMFPDCRKIELFARTAMPGWDAWGNEVEKFSEPENVIKSPALF